MSNKKNGIDINLAAKEIADGLINKLRSSEAFNISGSQTRANDCAPSGGLYTCEDKDCDSNFDCHPAKKFKCEKFAG